MNEELANIFNSAKQALNDDLKTNFASAVQARTQAFRQLNNKANASHALFSGMPSAMQMQYDSNTYLPNTATMAAQAIAKQEQNQEKWDQYMKQINQLNEQANYYRQQAQKYNEAIGKFSYTGASK